MKAILVVSLYCILGARSVAIDNFTDVNSILTPTKCKQKAYEETSKCEIGIVNVGSATQCVTEIIYKYLDCVAITDQDGDGLQALSRIGDEGESDSSDTSKCILNNVLDLIKKIINSQPPFSEFNKWNWSKIAIAVVAAMPSFVKCVLIQL